MLALELGNDHTPVGSTGFNRPQVAISGYNPLMMEGGKILERANKGLQTNFTSIGMVIPFQPSRLGDKAVEAVWENDKPDFLSLSPNAIYVSELLNNETGKPFFVTGSPNLVDLFCNRKPDTG